MINSYRNMFARCGANRTYRISNLTKRLLFFSTGKTTRIAPHIQLCTSQNFVSTKRWTLLRLQRCCFCAESSVGKASGGTFVSETRGCDDAGDGTRLSPFKSVKRALRCDSSANVFVENGNVEGEFEVSVDTW